MATLVRYGPCGCSYAPMEMVNMQDQRQQHAQDESQRPQRNRSDVQDTLGQERPDEQGPDQTAEPDGQFPDNDPAVGTIRQRGDEPVADTAAGASRTNDPDGFGGVAGRSGDADADLKRVGVEHTGDSGRRI